MNCQVGDSCIQTVIKWHCWACCSSHQTGHCWIHAWHGSCKCYLKCIFFNHHIASGACKQSPASKLLRVLPRPAVNHSFEVGQAVLHRNNSMKMVMTASYLIHAGRNTAWINTGNKTRFVSVEQLHNHDALTVAVFGQPPSSLDSDPASLPLTSTASPERDCESEPSHAVPTTPVQPSTPISRRSAVQRASGTGSAKAQSLWVG